MQDSRRWEATSMFFARKSKTDGKTIVSYRAKIRINGRSITKSFKRKTDAVTWRNRMEAEKQRQLATGLFYDPRITFDEFSAKWYKEKVLISNAKKTQDSYKRELHQHLLPLFGKTPLINITHSQTNNLVAKLKAEGLANKTINEIVILLKSILNCAVKWNFIARNPLLGYPQLKSTSTVFKFWTKEEISQFLNANIDDSLYPLFVVALNCGLRKGELLGLCWDRVNLSLGRIEVTRSLDRFGLKEHTKTFHRRILPLNEEVKQVLLMLLRMGHSTRYVFATPDGKPLDYNHIGRAFLLAQRRAGITNTIRFHDLRHTFASQFIMHKGDIYTLQKLLGHMSVNMTQRYSHLSEDFLQGAANVVVFSGHTNTSENSSEGLCGSSVGTPELILAQKACS